MPHEPAEAGAGAGGCKFDAGADGSRLLRLSPPAVLRLFLRVNPPAVLSLFLWAALLRAHPAMPPLALQNTSKLFFSILGLCLAAN
jgi:hypothetical protein